MADLLRLTVLNVCADEKNRNAFDQTLLKAGFEVQDAASGAEALRLAKENPDVIILDLLLPDMSGFEVCCRLKAHSATAAIPVLHLSPSPVEGEEHAEHLSQGDEAYLTHPVDAAEVVATVRALVRGRQIEKQFHGFVEAAPDAVVIVDQEGKIVRVNEQAEKMFGYRREEMVKQDVEILLPERYRDRHRAQRGSFMVNPNTRPMGSGLELLGLRKNGSQFPVEISLSPLPTFGGMLVSSIIRDVSERKRMEMKLREADRHKDEFLAMLAHELRNPLTPIRNAVQILKMVNSPDPRHDWAANVIDRQAAQLALLVDDLLDVSRIIHGKLSLRKESVELGRVVAQALETSRPNIDARRHKLTVSLPPQSVRLDADPARLIQIWTNLLNNAAKYTEEGGQIWFTAEVQEGQVLVRVRDTGIGISEDKLPQVFDLFNQVESAKDHSQGGLGIGLAMVRRLIQMHRGTIQAFSDGLGKGSEFVTSLPILPEGLPSHVEESSTETSVCRRILLVDDNVDLAESIAVLLEKDGHEVQVVHDGPTVVDSAKNFRPQVVFMDIGLPGMSGYDVARQIRTQPGLEKLMLVAMSGYGNEEERQIAQDAGFDEFILKPFNSESLKMAITRCKA